jgi:hypothetical protein
MNIQNQNDSIFWREHEKIQSEVSQANDRRILDKLTAMGVVSVDVRYVHRDSNDEGHGQMQPVSATLADGSVIDLNVPRGKTVDPSHPGHALLAAQVESHWVETFTKDGNWAIKHGQSNESLLVCLTHINTMNDDFMIGHGSYFTESNSDDEGGSVSVTIHEGRARMKVSDGVFQPLNDQGQVIQPLRFPHRRW